MTNSHILRMDNAWGRRKITAVLRGLGRGEASQRIANRLGISPRSVGTIKGNARRGVYDGDYGHLVDQISF